MRISITQGQRTRELCQLWASFKPPAQRIRAAAHLARPRPSRFLHIRACASGASAPFFHSFHSRERARRAHARIRIFTYPRDANPSAFAHHTSSPLTFHFSSPTTQLPATSDERHSPRPPPPSLPRPSPFIAPSLPLTLPPCLYPFAPQHPSAAQRHSPRPPLSPAQVQPRCSGQFFVSPLRFTSFPFCSTQFPATPVVSESGLSSGFRYCLLSGHCGVALFHCCLCCITGCSPIYMNSKPDFYVADSLMNPMSDKGKAIATASKKRKRSKTSTPPPSANYARNPLNEEEKENQLLPSTDPTKFPNLYCELRLSRYAKKNLNIEKKLNLPNDVRRAINARISELGLDFVDRDLGRINISWVKEFYCNFFRPSLDSVFLRGREIMITEDALRDALLCRVGTPETCAYQQAEVALLSMTFNYEALRRVIATPDASWVMDSSNTKPKGMLFAHLTREARTWQQIFAHYVFPTTHFSEIPMDMLVLIGCVMEGKEVYFPRLIRHSMWRAHIRGLLPFPTLVTSLAELADVPWEDNDVTPPPPDDDDKEVTIPWGVWVHERPPTSRRSRARAAVEAAIPSSLTAAPPPSALEPTYLLALISLGAELPPLPDSPTSDEQDHQEEDANEPLQGDAPPAAPNTTEIPQTHEEPVPQPQSEPEPIVVPPTDPPV
ncbi:hypothetical protein AHAS_Ahas11G0152200 [Arachis hypogaea]